MHHEIIIRLEGARLLPVFVSLRYAIFNSAVSFTISYILTLYLSLDSPYFIPQFWTTLHEF